IPLTLAIVFALALAQQRDTRTRTAHIVFWLKRAAVLGGTMFVLIAAVYSANYAAFHSFAKSDLSSPSFEKAFKALLRIKPSHSQRYIAVSAESVQRAFEVSPHFALLKPHFEAPNGRMCTNPA